MAIRKHPYDVHPGVAMMQKWVADLPAKTGRTLDEWSEVARKLGKKSNARKDIISKLKEEYGHGSNTAWHIYEYTFGRATWDGDADVYLANAAQYVDDQYAGTKAHFRPLFESVLAFVRTLPGVKVCPCKSMVPFYRERVFAQVRPATKTRFEVCLALEETPFGGLLLLNPRAVGSDRQRHMIAMEAENDFNATAKKWLKKAYEQDA
ncbi:hypothetical protein BH11PLA2_BH11PLA2_41990 [soil metagenome]